MLVFGITGDLMRLKGIPALFALWEKKKLPEDFRILGLSRKIWKREALTQHIEAAVGRAVPPEFSDLFSVYTGEGEDPATIINLKNEFNLSPENLLIYLSVSPALYTTVLGNLAEADILAGPRILIEKPFGFDLRSAQDLEQLLLKHTDEEHIYRVDHFLAKEAMKDLSALPREDVVSIEVYLNESFGVEKRGAMYDPVGAFRDVGQNHLLEAAAAVLGDRAAALENLHILSPEEIKTETSRGQYEGYLSIDGVAPRSQTETYFKVMSYFMHGGKKIPLTLESGKRMHGRREVVVTLAGGEKKVIPFESGTNEYEKLFAEVLAGKRELFVSMREVEALWRFTDPLEESWKGGEPTLASYQGF